MSTVALVAEGEFDVPVLKVLIQRILSHNVSVIDRTCHGDGNVLKFFTTHLNILASEVNLDKALVVRDLGTTNPLTPNKLRQEMQNQIDHCGYAFPVKPVVIVKEMEAWLLADEKALATITRKKVATIKSPETIKHPKDTLLTILSKAKPYIPYTPQVAESIANLLRIDILEKRCPSFQRYRHAVLDC